MSRVHLTFFRPPSDTDEEPSAKSALKLADWGVKEGAWAPEAFAPRAAPSSVEPERSEASDADPLAAFDSERDAEAGVDDLERLRSRGVRPAAPMLPSAPSRFRTRRALGLILLLAVAGSAAAVQFVWGGGFLATPTTTAPTGPLEGRAIISSNPTGALVFIDGVARGATPLDLGLTPGMHTVQLQSGTALRTLPLEVAQGQVSSQYIELPAVDSAPTAQPSATLSSPVPSSVTGRAPEPRQVPGRDARPASQATQPVTSVRESAGTGRAAVSRSPAAVAPPAALADGWVNLNAPFPVQVSEGGRDLGSTAAGPLKLSGGLHTLDLANAAFEFRTTLAVRITPGETTSAPLTLPMGMLSVNALPWAEVFVDGRAIGTTPLANVAVPIGQREILWRHPEFGERRQLITVTARTPVRIGTDFNRAN